MLRVILNAYYKLVNFLENFLKWILENIVIEHLRALIISHI